eukprot:CAMPEP_0119410698 /NCGR_PEP_ID=MMETSP1335-20130426/3651_1 /TAXON_ID=259385 /ORGANISM="Chrysoculter rhomboideus, Strain RCC1486" /LENGTH=135 /DNA_ID=CAMNT_0007435267 /DNA_START=142 /DNA_END=549 /DNA_ORIENTATION=-
MELGPRYDTPRARTPVQVNDNQKAWRIELTPCLTLVAFPIAASPCTWPLCTSCPTIRRAQSAATAGQSQSPVLRARALTSVLTLVTGGVSDRRRYRASCWAERVRIITPDTTRIDCTASTTTHATRTELTPAARA